jgi:nucleoid DNA-binding protein
MEEKLPKILTKYEFIRELAKRADFTIADTKIMWKEVEGLFADAIASDVEIDIQGFGHLMYKPIKPRTQKNPKTLEIKSYESAERVIFRLSKTLKELRKPFYKRDAGKQAIQDKKEEDAESIA